MKLVVINFSGNVGKSSVARHLLAPRLPGARLIPIESINADEAEEQAIRGKQFSELMDCLLDSENVIVDVGASNVEDFISRMSQYHGSHEDFDYYIVPTVVSKKQQLDTIATVNALSEIGVDGEKIKIIFNRADQDIDIKRDFSKVFSAFSLRKGLLPPDPSIAIKDNDIYGLLEGESIENVLNDNTDFAQKIKDAPTREEKVLWSRRRGLQRLAKGVKAELDGVFSRLFKGEA